MSSFVRMGGAVVQGEGSERQRGDKFLKMTY